jgi:hypothetical protein
MLFGGGDVSYLTVGKHAHPNRIAFHTIEKEHPIAVTEDWPAGPAKLL